MCQWEQTITQKIASIVAQGLSQIIHLITQHATEGQINVFTEFDVLKITFTEC